MRDFLFEDGQPIKQFIALADRVIEASSAHKAGEADAKMFTFTTYYREHQTEIHKGFAYIYGILLDTKNRIENHMKPQADKIIENTCSALIRRLTD